MSRVVDSAAAPATATAAPPPTLPVPPPICAEILGLFWEDESLGLLCDAAAVLLELLCCVLCADLPLSCAATLGLSVERVV